MKILKEEKIRNITEETQKEIIDVQKKLSKQFGFNVSKNQTLNYILSEGSKFINNNN